MLLQKLGKSQLEINDLMEELFYTAKSVKSLVLTNKKL